MAHIKFYTTYYPILMPQEKTPDLVLAVHHKCVPKVFVTHYAIIFLGKTYKLFILKRQNLSETIDALE